MAEDLFEKLVEIGKRRGFFWPSYEIYGGVAGFYDWGPLGHLLKRRIIEKWRRYFVLMHQDHVVEIETPVIGPEKVYIASGHVEHFTDPIVRCTSCGRTFRADHLVEEALGINAEGLSVSELDRIIRERGLRCPVCQGELGRVETFNLLFRTQIGPYEGSVGYLRPELAQGIFVAFKRVYEAMRSRIPLGIAQVGRVGRNEISPRQALVRLREFTIMEMEYFIDPEDQWGSCPFFHRMADSKLPILTYEAKRRGEEKPESFKLEEAVNEGVVISPCLGYWMAVGMRFVEDLGVPSDSIMFEEKGPEERAHYSSQTFDQLVKVSRWGWIEVAGHSYRGDYDLSRHMKYSGQDLTAFKPYPKPIVVKKRRVVVDKAAIGRALKSRAKTVLEELGRMGEGELERLAASSRPVVAGVELPPGSLRIVEVEEKVSGRRFVPHVVEPSFGTDRNVYVALEYAYREVEGRVVLAFPRDIAPVQAVVLPLVENDEKLVERARMVYETLVEAGFTVYYDDSGSIGRRYARADEIGVPAAVTIDYQTLEDGTVTLRDRDTWRQVRIGADEVVDKLRRFIYDGARLEDLGTPVKP
ncbi:glycine-tRNA ligase [Aeropyrum pernix]|uniref:Glycine--tRNA ligase n=1 Tax=Aeropyrum pernix TaxID=56636 RepID=A0A401HBI3_AERPX|nr:glycine--tRNA ligase [Aeropyrum pernix]GBF09777.1 glycine-tRNA ligase [Aeropyrum pernix]